MKECTIQQALLTRTEIEWLLGNVKVPRTYEYTIKSYIKKKLKAFIDLEIPLLIEKRFIDITDLSKYTQNLRTDPQVKDHKNLQLPSEILIQSQNMVVWKGCHTLVYVIHFRSIIWKTSPSLSTS